MCILIIYKVPTNLYKKMGENCFYAYIYIYNIICNIKYYTYIYIFYTNTQYCFFSVYITKKKILDKTFVKIY